jgi:hypothetical protein
LKQFRLANDVEAFIIWLKIFATSLDSGASPASSPVNQDLERSTLMLSLLPDLGGTKFWERAGIAGL